VLCGNLLEVVVLITVEATQLATCHGDASQVQQAAETMSDKRVYGHSRSGEPITDTEVETFAAEAKAGFDVDELLARRPKRGRPALVSSRRA